MARALYDPELGYYSGREPRTGWQGHFVTSPELDPGFGRLWVAGIEQIWRDCGAPQQFNIYEVGPGEGGLAESILDGLNASQLKDRYHYFLVERTRAGTERQRERLRGRGRLAWIDSLDDVDPVPGVVFLHELLDNVPVHLVERHEGQLVELSVTESDGDLILTRGPLAPDLLELARHLFLQEGQRAELAPQRDEVVRSSLAAISTGAVVIVDYGLDDGGWADHPSGTVACYSSTGADADPLDRPGLKDITSHVDWSAVRRAVAAAAADPLGPFPQRDVLKALGIEALHSELKAAYEAAVAEGRGADALRTLSRRQALGVLGDPAGLGRLQVMLGVKGLPTAGLFSNLRTH